MHCATWWWRIGLLGPSIWPIPFGPFHAGSGLFGNGRRAWAVQSRGINNNVRQISLSVSRVRWILPNILTTFKFWIACIWYEQISSSSNILFVPTSRKVKSERTLSFKMSPLCPFDGLDSWSLLCDYRKKTIEPLVYNGKTSILHSKFHFSILFGSSAVDIGKQ
jgi:hypothetical protein